MEAHVHEEPVQVVTFAFIPAISGTVLSHGHAFLPPRYAVAPITLPQPNNHERRVWKSRLNREQRTKDSKIQNKITTIEELMSFDAGGYAYQPDLSNEQILYFVR